MVFGQRKEFVETIFHQQEDKTGLLSDTNPEELFDAVGYARVFSTLDLRSDYHQLLLWLQYQFKTTFGGLIAMKILTPSLKFSSFWSKK